MTTPHKHRWHQFSLRILFSLVTAAAVGLAAYRWMVSPCIQVTKSIIELGDISENTRGKSHFDVHNSGWVPVKIQPSSWSRACGFEKPCVDSIPPGESRRIEVWWHVRKGEDQAPLNRAIVWNFLLATDDQNSPWVDLTVKCQRIP